ncbi:MAG: hypothetical protein ABSH32_01375 [Bryobacteraceae bacterium]|jgi:hypothetical protein
MELSEVYLKLGEGGFGQLIRSISIGKLKTYQLYDAFKASGRLTKLNTEILDKHIPGFWARLGEHDEQFAKDLAQTVLVSHLDMIAAVLDFLGVPHEGGFFNKDVNAKSYLTEGWAERTFERFSTVYPAPVLLFYINHLSWELTDQAEPFVPASAA